MYRDRGEIGLPTANETVLRLASDTMASENELSIRLDFFFLRLRKFHRFLAIVIESILELLAGRCAE